MSRSLFQSAEPAIPLHISAVHQKRLATWVLKTAYLIDAYQASVIPRGFLHELALQRTPNPWTVIWVGGYTTDSAVRADKRVIDFLTESGEQTKNSPNAFVITFTILNLVFQVAGHFNGGTWTLDDNRQQYKEALFRIWPDSEQGLGWPPAYGFSNNSWKGLVSSIKPR
jgi:hypothetical protein